MKKYLDTLYLPQANLPMKAKLSEKELEYVERWDSKYYIETIKKWASRPKFVILDGPPYANGKIHLGHAVNKIIKDLVNRSKALEGYSVQLIPGWDCHGLPIEQSVRNLYQDSIAEKDWLPAYREYAQSQIEEQKEDFKRLGLFADWDNHYATMSKSYEAGVVRTLGKIWKKGYIYRDLKPVHWCSECKSALSIAEIEFTSKPFTSIYFKSTLLHHHQLSDKIGVEVKSNTAFVIWTTTPWTISENQALAVGRDISYVYLESAEENMIVSAQFAKNPRFIGPQFKMVATFPGSELEGLTAWSPLAAKEVKVYCADFIEDREDVPAVVHISPAHGEDDYRLAKKFSISTATGVTREGKYSSMHPLFATLDIHSEEVDKRVLELLEQKGALFLSETKHHDKAICWRHKIPLFYLATQQWFINLQHEALHTKVESFVQQLQLASKSPKCWKNLKQMIDARSSWCISRQRKWGVPLPFFFHNLTGDLHPDTESIIEKTASLIEKGGIEQFISYEDFQHILDDADHYTWSGDTVDIWFDSGCASLLVSAHPIDLVIEGRDQQRGWFQSSFLIGLMAAERSPFKDIIAHGFTLDAENNKMSKSQGNVITLQEAIRLHGASVLRLYIAAQDWKQDFKVSHSIIEHYAVIYRKIRNTMRFLSGCSYPHSHKTEPNLVELDAYILEQAKVFSQELRQDYRNYNFARSIRRIYDFCTNDLSAFYIRIAKYRLYTCNLNSEQSISVQITCQKLLNILICAVSPIMPCLSQEVLDCLSDDRQDVLQLEWPNLTSQTGKMSPSIWNKIRHAVELVDLEFEHFKISHSKNNLQKSTCAIEMHWSGLMEISPFFQLEGDFDLARIFGVAQVKLIPSESDIDECSCVQVNISILDNAQKCERCRIYFVSPKASDLCRSCEDILANLPSHCKKV